MKNTTYLTVLGEILSLLVCPAINTPNLDFTFFSLKEVHSTVLEYSVHLEISISVCKFMSANLQMQICILSCSICQKPSSNNIVYNI